MKATILTVFCSLFFATSAFASNTFGCSQGTVGKADYFRIEVSANEALGPVTPYNTPVTVVSKKSVELGGYFHILSTTYAGRVTYNQPVHPHGGVAFIEFQGVDGLNKPVTGIMHIRPGLESPQSIDWLTNDGKSVHLNCEPVQSAADCPNQLEK